MRIIDKRHIFLDVILSILIILILAYTGPLNYHRIIKLLNLINIGIHQTITQIFNLSVMPCIGIISFIAFLVILFVIRLGRFAVPTVLYNKNCFGLTRKGISGLVITNKKLIIFILAYLICGMSTQYLFSPDSIGYTSFDLFNRPFIVPLANMLMLEMPFFIVILQSVISACSWWFFASVISGKLKNNYKTIMFTVIILFSLSHSIIRWNNAIESESYCLSAILILTAMIFSEARYNLFTWIMGVIFFIFTRDTNVYLLLFIMLLIVYKLRTNTRQCVQIVIISSILALMNIVMCLHSDTRSVQPTASNYQFRVFLNETLTEYFHWHYGMPIPEHTSVYNGDTYEIANLLSDNKPYLNLYSKDISEFMEDLGQKYPKIFELWSIYKEQIESDSEYANWFSKYGKKSFVNYLIVNRFFIKSSFHEYYNYIFVVPSFTEHNYIFNPSYKNGLSEILIIVGLVMNNLFTVLILFLLGCIFSIFKYRTLIIPKSLIAVDIVLLVGFFSNSLIAFWGCGMEFSRHCFIPGTAINLIILINSVYVCYFSSLNKRL